ncbi:MAG: hypothetical protein J5521_09195 [Lachnospiraceae bacterium]|nr:hypothetical protein [Lachnospiraceae bacterium]
MKLVTGNIVNTERKFIIDLEKVHAGEPQDWEASLGKPVESYTIDQFYKDGVKYREIMTEELDEFEDEMDAATVIVGYTKNIKNGSITNVTEIPVEEYMTALHSVGNHASTKVRTTYEKNGFHIDIDEYITTELTLIEVSGDNLDQFVPPEFLKEVTDQAAYSAKEIYAKEAYLKEKTI